MIEWRQEVAGWSDRKTAWAPLLEDLFCLMLSGLPEFPASWGAFGDRL